jgi:hypothetical protein
MPFEMKSIKKDSIVEVGSDISDNPTRTVADRDDETLARLGKKPVLKVC